MLHVIFSLIHFYLGGARAYWGLPNNPNYDLPAWHNSICDTINAITTLEPKQPELNVFYHPDWKKLVNASALKMAGMIYTSLPSMENKFIIRFHQHLTVISPPTFRLISLLPEVTL
ncbi:MAG: hypothetical protein U0X76_09745 [Bacteroidia bacterium]